MKEVQNLMKDLEAELNKKIELYCETKVIIMLIVSIYNFIRIYIIIYNLYISCSYN